MFGKKVAQDSMDENLLEKKKISRKRVLFVSGAVALLLVGFIVGKASMSGEFENAKQVNKNSQGVLKELSDKNTQLQGQIKRLENIIVQRKNKKQELASAFQAAISIQDALSIINNKIASIKANTQRIKSSYISDNSEVKNLDSGVIKQLINVVDVNTDKQLQGLAKAIKILTDYQKNQMMVIDAPKQDIQDIQANSNVSQKDSVIIKEDSIIEPLDFNRSN